MEAGKAGDTAPDGINTRVADISSRVWKGIRILNIRILTRSRFHRSYVWYELLCGCKRWTTDKYIQKLDVVKMRF